MSGVEYFLIIIGGAAIMNGSCTAILLFVNDVPVPRKI
jgi:hypothetical protein